LSWVWLIVVGIAATLVGQLLWIELAIIRLRGKPVSSLSIASLTTATRRELGPAIDRLRERHPNLYKLDISASPDAGRPGWGNISHRATKIPEGRRRRSSLG
jgi:hypothetical protein